MKKLKNIIFTDDISLYIDLYKSDILENLEANGIEATSEAIEQEAQYMIQADAEAQDLQKITGRVLAVGSCELWYGRQNGGRIFKDFTEALTTLAENYNTIYTERKNGALQLEAIHHDGVNYFKFYEISDTGEQFIKNHQFLDRKTLHEKLIKNKYVKALTVASLWG